MPDFDLLGLLGRVLRVAPAALLRDPATDPVAIAASVLAGIGSWVRNGTAFVPPVAPGGH